MFYMNVLVLLTPVLLLIVRSKVRFFTYYGRKKFSFGNLQTSMEANSTEHSLMVVSVFDKNE